MAKIKPNYSPTIEQDLLAYIQSGDERLFTDKIYIPLRSMAVWLITNKSYDWCDIDDLINELLIHSWQKLKIYDKSKSKDCTALSWCRKMMEQKLHRLYYYHTNSKRNYLLATSIQQTDKDNEEYVKELTYDVQDDLYFGESYTSDDLKDERIKLGIWLEYQGPRYVKLNKDKRHLITIGRILQGLQPLVLSGKSLKLGSHFGISNSTFMNRLKTIKPLIIDKYFKGDDHKYKQVICAG